MRIAVVTCKVKPPSADNMDFEEAQQQPKGNSPVPSNSNSNGFSPFNPPPSTFYRLPSATTANDDFVREVIQLCNFWGKSKQVGHKNLN